MSATEDGRGQEAPEGPETPESPEAPDMAEEVDAEKVEEPQEREEAPEEPDIYEFSEESGYTAGDLEPVYEEIDEESYKVDEEAEKVLLGSSDWENIEGLLSGDEGGSGVSDSWTDKVKSYLFDHDTEYAAGGATWIGAGILTASLGYTVAGGLMITGGSAALGWGIGSYIGDRISEYISDGETEEDSKDERDEPESDHELAEYSEWDIEIVDEEAYEEAVEEYLQQAQ